MYGAKSREKGSPGQRIKHFFKNNAGSLILMGILIGYFGYQKYTLYSTDKHFIDRPAPDFTLRNLQGESVRLSELRGKYVLINFWATWCAPCRVEIPILRDLYDDLKSENFELLGVASEPESVVRKFTEDVTVNYPVLLDVDGRVASAFAVAVYPSILIVDPDGNISSITHGLNPLLKWKVRWLVTGSPF